MTWTALAEQLDDTRDLGQRAAGCQASAWAAGLDPEAMRSLTGAALALGARPAELLGQAAPWDSDAAMLADAEDLAADVARRLCGASQLAGQIRGALAAARATLAAALAEQPPDLAAADATRAAIADCETAIETEAPLELRLSYALARLAEVPADLAGIYAAAHRYIAAGGVLPYDGRWLTGTAR